MAGEAGEEEGLAVQRMTKATAMPASMCRSPARAQAACAPAMCWQVLEDGREPFGKPAPTGGLSTRPMLAEVNGNFGSF